jgi:hypothetical protein
MDTKRLLSLLKTTQTPEKEILLDYVDHLVNESRY